MRENQIRVLYNKNQALDSDLNQSFSRSPEKPRLLLEHLERVGLGAHFSRDENFVPFTPAEFRVAHMQNYVEDFFAGRAPLCSSNGIPWSSDFARSVRYTNASLYHAVAYALDHPAQITFSPTSGFHHATPTRGQGFCTFSGQVLASVRLFRERGVCGAYLDLDAHYGNSIEDSRAFVPDLDQAIPLGCNINPIGAHRQFGNDLAQQLRMLGELVREGKIHYVVMCHGADSHKDDDLGGQCTTEEWLECSRMIYEWVRDIDVGRDQPLPLTLSLFGGYRKDDYESVLSLHASDLAACLKVLCGVRNDYLPRVRPKAGH